jgi:hypothetical protein
VCDATSLSKTDDAELSWIAQHQPEIEEPPISAFVAPLLIYVLTPILGVLVFLALVHKMRSAMIVSPPIIPFFILFFTLGGCLTVLLTAWFLGVVEFSLARNGLPDLYCPCTQGLYVLAPSYSTHPVEVSCMCVLPRHGVHLLNCHRCAFGIRDSLWHELAKHRPQFAHVGQASESVR